MVGVSVSSSASASSWEAKEDGVLLRDEEGQASEGSKVRLRSGRVLETRTRSFSYSSAARRSTFLYLGGKQKEDQRKKEANASPTFLQCLSLPNCPTLNHQSPLFVVITNSLSTAFTFKTLPLSSTSPQ